MKNKKSKLIGCVVSDVGLKRDNNEDNFLLGHCLNEQRTNHTESYFCQDVSEWTWAAVFDGMGGEEGGEIASLLTAQVFQEKSFQLDKISKEVIDEEAEKAFAEANTAVIEAKKQYRTCGTTGTLIATNGEEFRVFHKGDSRVYLLRENKLYLLTKDQTLAQLKLDVGIYHSKEDVPERENHQLTEFIGLEDSGGISKPYTTDWMEWKDEDRLLLCSDGLYDMCENQEIYQYLQSNQSIEEVANILLQLALKNGGKDNVTILILERI